MADIGIAGAGFSGAVIARQLADAGHRVTVFESRNHVAGNCHTARDANTGVMVHEYGPHIFHTQWDHVWRYINRFGRLRRYDHRVRATTGGAVYTLPVNLHSINQFFGTTMSPAEAAAFVAARTEGRSSEPVSFEEQALAFVGRELYEAFFAGYTRKQWGTDPAELPASILKRLPLRFSYDDRYFDHPYQAIPEDGYTPIVEAMLDHARVDVRLAEPLRTTDTNAFDHVVWCGPIDSYFDVVHGPLGYRTLIFEREYHEGDYQGCPVMNYCDESVAFTRTTEFKHFAAWEHHERTVVYREYSAPRAPGDIPYYPIRLVREKQQLRAYVELARLAAGVTFVGRLGTYRYLDMDVTIKESLDAAAAIGAALESGASPPAFVVDPLG